MLCLSSLVVCINVNTFGIVSTMSAITIVIITVIIMATTIAMIVANVVRAMVAIIF